MPKLVREKMNEFTVKINEKNVKKSLVIETIILHFVGFYNAVVETISFP